MTWGGEMQQYKNMFVLEVKPEEFKVKIEELRKQLKENKDNNELLDDFIEISIDIQSYLLKWNLQNSNNDKTIFDEEIADEIKKNYSLLEELGCAKEIDEIKKEVESINSCNMYKLTLESDKGLINNRWGNNDGTGLKHAMGRGVVLVTTNPKIVNALRKRFPEYWNKKKEEIRQQHNDSTPEQIAARITMEVVLESARLLRPVYLAGDVHMGYVSFQLNPNLSKDAKAMIKDAMMVYGWLKEAFNGEEPNIVFKIPGTFAGLEVAKELTIKGIGVNITINYSVAQQLAFGEIIEAGNAKHCYLTQMNKRLEAPVAEEIGEGECDDPSKISSWASSAVIRRAYNALYKEKNYKKSVLLGASINRPWHVQRSITGGTDYPLHTTIAPEELEDFDSELNDFSPHISEEIGEEIIEKLLQSETFRKAYELDGLQPEDFDDFKPTLTTLNGFKENYDEFLQWCKE